MEKTWVSLVYNRLNTTPYEQFPYAAEFLLDDLVAIRFARQFGADNYWGINLIPDGFYDTKAITIDYSGKWWGRNTEFEIGCIYPAGLYRHDQIIPVDEEEVITVKGIGDKVWPGGVFKINLIDDKTNFLTLRLGYMGKGFISNFGACSLTEMEDDVKFYPNTGGIDLLYQRGLANNIILGLNLVYLTRVESAKDNSDDPPTIFDIKLKKYLSTHSEISLSTAYLLQDKYHYGRIILNWKTSF